MATKKFVAADMRSALKLVREELGADAVILSNRKVDEGIEIVASADYESFIEQSKEKEEAPPAPVAQCMDVTAKPIQEGDPKRVVSLVAGGFSPSEKDKADLIAALQRREQETKRKKSPAKAQPKKVKDSRSSISSVQPTSAVHDDEPTVQISNQAQRQFLEQFTEQVAPPVTEVQPLEKSHWERPEVKPETQVENGSHTPPELMAMMGEISQLRQMMNVQMTNVTWGSYGHRNPLQAAVFKRLAGLGLSPVLCRKFVRNLRPDVELERAWKQALVELENELPLQHQDLISQGGVHVFVGPAGIGKTTTIAKIATKYVLDKGADSLALITTDSYRIAGHEQLGTLGKILKIPVYVVSDRNPLEEVLLRVSGKQTILIDTAGLSVKDQAHSEQMAMLNGLADYVRRWLVVSTTCQRKILDRAMSEYKTLNLDGCIFTKLDESASLGEALSVAVEAQLPIAYVTDGQSIPDDIAQPQAESLVERAIALAKEGEMDDSQLAELYGDACSEIEIDLAYG